LFGIYTQFMRENNLVKLQGNRNVNHHIGLMKPEKPSNNKIAPISFS